MLLDAQILFSDDQLLSAASVGANASTNIYDGLAADRDLGKGDLLWFYAMVTVTATSGGAATLDIQLQTDNAVGFGSAVTLYSTGAQALATVAKGFQVRVPVPIGGKRYYRVNYQVGTAVFTAGKIKAAFVKNVDAQQFYPRGAFGVA